jgi:hypothetical protein
MAIVVGKIPSENLEEWCTLQSRKTDHRYGWSANLQQHLAQVCTSKSLP